MSSRAKSPSAGARPVAQVAPFYPPRLGGVENVTRALAESLAERRPVEVVTTRCGAPGAAALERRDSGEQATVGGDDRSAAKTSGLTVRRYRGVSIAHTPVSPGFVWRLLRLPRRTVVHAHFAQAFVPEVVWMTSRLRRRPYLAHFHLDVDPSGRLGFLLAGYKQRVLGPILRGAAGVIALSQSQREFLTSTYRVPAERVHVMPNGVPDDFVAAHPRHRQPSASEPIRLLFVGRLEAQKNATRLLDAVAAMHQPAELVVVGDGEQSEQLQRHARRLGLTWVRFVGAQRENALRGYYAWADVCVSSSDREGVPLVLLEAMAAGLPVVATDVDGTRQLLAGIGLLTGTHPDDLAAGLDRVAADHELRADLAVRSHRRGRESSWAARIGQLEQIYDQVFDQLHPPSEDSSTGSNATPQEVLV